MKTNKQTDRKEKLQLDKPDDRFVVIVIVANKHLFFFFG